MTEPLVRFAGDFAVARPIPWNEDDTLRDHLDRVIDALTATDGVVEVDTEADLDRGHVRLAIVLAEPGEDADRTGRVTIAVAIRQCDGRHFQLLPLEEEAEFSHRIPSRSGLLTPLWRLRTVSVEPLDGE